MFFLNGFLTHHGFIEQEDNTRPSGPTICRQLKSVAKVNVKPFTFAGGQRRPYLY